MSWSPHSMQGYNTSIFGPIECHHLVSFYRKKGEFRPERIGLKRSHVKVVEVVPNLPRGFMKLLDVDIRPSATSPAKKGQSPNLSYVLEATVAGVYSLEALLRRGLGYRIIFNMGGKVYNPEDPSTLPDVAIVVTDFSGNQETDRLSIPNTCWRLPQGDMIRFFQAWSGCVLLEVTYTCERVIITRDGKVELEFFHFDKLLSPEQLKIYNNYGPVLGRLYSVTSSVDPKRSDNMMVSDLDLSLSSLSTRILGLARCLSGTKNLTSKSKTPDHIMTKLKAAVAMVHDHILIPIQPSDDEIRKIHEQAQFLLANFEKVSQDAGDLRTRISELFDEILNLSANNTFRSCKFLKMHFDQLAGDTRNQVANFFCIVGRSKIDLMLLEAIKRLNSDKLKQTRYAASSSRICTTQNYEVQVRKHELRFKKLSGLDISITKVALPLGVLPDREPLPKRASGLSEGHDSSDSGSEDQSNASTGMVTQEKPKHNTGGEALCDDKLDEINPIDGDSQERMYRYELTPLLHDRVLLSAGNMLNAPKVIVELDRLHRLRLSAKSDTLSDDVWVKETDLINEPYFSRCWDRFLPMIEHVSNTSITVLSHEYDHGLDAETGENSRIVLSFMSLSRHQHCLQWIPEVVMDGPEARRISREVLGSVYHSLCSGYIFASTRHPDLGYKLMCYKVDVSAKKMQPVCQSNFEEQATTKEYCDGAHYWLEKKTKVFFYSVISSPEIKLKVICFHRSRFTTIGSRKTQQTFSVPTCYNSRVLSSSHSLQAFGMVQHSDASGRFVCCWLTPDF